MSPDPSLLASLSFTLTRADALAYESLPREMRGWRKAAFFVWMGLAGVWLSLLPDSWVGEEHGWRFWVWGAALVAVQYGLFGLGMTLAAHRRAAGRAPRPKVITVRDHGTYIEWCEDGATTYVAAETVWPIIHTPRHVFAEVGAMVLILPSRAFEDAAGMAGFARELERRAGG